MDKQARIEQIARALKPAFRRYLLEQDGWEGITPAQRRILDEVVRDPEQKSLLGPLTGMMVAYGTNSDIERDAYYNIGVALGVRKPDRPSFLDEIRAGSDAETYIYERDLETEAAPGGGRFVREDPGSPAFETGGQYGTETLGPRPVYNYPDAEFAALGRTGEDPLGRDADTPGFGRGMGESDTRPTPERAYEGLPQPDSDGDGGEVGGDGVAVAPPAEDVTLPEDWEKAAEEQYGAYWAIFKYNPELKKILLDATMNDWPDDKFRAALEQTDWWKTTSEAARTFDMEEATDPATIQTKIDNRAMELKGIALNEGVTLSDETAAQIARDSLRGGWNYQTYSTAVTAEAVKSTAGLSQLRAGAIGQRIRETAASYGVTLGDTEINNYVNRIAVGEESATSFEGKMREYAKVLYPAISNQIDDGSTFTDIVAPYRSKAAAILELEPDQIDFMDSKYLAAVTKTNDKGEQSMMSAREWEQELRTNRQFGYEFTQQAQSAAYSVADEIANLFGRV